MGKTKKNKADKAVKGVDERALFVFGKVRALLNLPTEISRKKKKWVELVLKCTLIERKLM